MQTITLKQNLQVIQLVIFSTNCPLCDISDNIAWTIINMIIAHGLLLV